MKALARPPAKEPVSVGQGFSLFINASGMSRRLLMMLPLIGCSRLKMEGDN